MMPANSPRKLILLALLFLNSLCASVFSFANEQNQPLLVFHSGLEKIDNLYMMSLIVDLEKKLPTHKLRIIDTNNLSVVQLKAYLEQKQSCVLTIGEQSLRQVLSTRNSTPIFSTLVSKNTLDTLAASYARLGSVVTGIYTEQSFERQILLSKTINNKIENIAVILGRSTRYSLKEYQQISRKQLIPLKFDILKYQESPQQSFARFKFDQGFLLILNDNQNYSPQHLQSLLVTSYRKQMPMIGNKRADSKIAALASVYSPPKTLALETTKGLQQICVENIVPKAKHAESFKVVINNQIAKHLSYEDLNEDELAQSIHAAQLSQMENTLL